MKVISGKYKGRILNGFDIKGTRPTMDRVKESLFAMIQDYVKESIVLDLYSGSGNLAIEAISNGSSYAYMVDNNVVAINTINKNIKLLNINNAKVIKSDAFLALNSFLKEDIIFDIIFLDPPYNTNELDKVLSFINSNISILSSNGIIVAETSLKIDYTKYNSLKVYKERKYNDKTVTILKISE